MFISSRSILAACLIAIPIGAAADGLADRYNESGTQQAMDTIETIHETYGATAAGPTPTKEVTFVSSEMEPDDLKSNIDFPAGVDTAHERKRYIFDSNEF